MTAQTCTLYLVRHGQTQWNVDRIIQGHTDIPLNKNGEVQALAQSEKLKDVRFDAAYSSDLIRAKRTAEILLLERKLAVITTQKLRERSFGLYEGKPIDDKHKKLCELLAQYNDHPHIKESRVETNDLIIGRVFTFLREISLAHLGKTVLVASHGGILRQVLIHLAYATEVQLASGSVQNLAYLKLESDGVDFFIKDTSGVTFPR